MEDSQPRSSQAPAPFALISPSPEKNIHRDSSESLFTVYLKSVEKKDNQGFKNWQKDADGIIFFNGLFSAVIAALVAVSIQDLRPNPQETSAFYLEKMYQLQADPNISHPSISSTTADPRSFSPPTYAVWVNSLWILSLAINLSCALLVLSWRQWTSRYLRITQEPRGGRYPRDRARTRAFFANGIRKYRVPRVIEILPVPAHLSLFIFFVGLLIYLFNINHTVFRVVMCLMALLLAIYGAITVMPIFWLDCPYYSPLSQPARSCYIRISYLVLKVLFGFSCTFEACRRIGKWIEKYDREKCQGAMSELDRAISKQSAKIDLRILQRTISYRREEDELEKAIESIPGFLNSDEVKVPLDGAQDMTEDALSYFLHYTLSSNSVPEDVKTHRLAVCLKIASEDLRPALCDFGNIFSGMIHVNWDGGLECLKIGHYLISWNEASHWRIKRYIRGVVTVIVASGQEHNESNGPWVTLARNHLGIEDDVFQEYLRYGDSVLLANLIHFSESRHRHGDAYRTDYFAVKVVRSLSRFDVRNTHPDLKLRFYAVWNDVVGESQNGDPYSHSVDFLRAIDHHYRPLRQGADAGTETCLGLNLITPTPYQSSYSLGYAPSQLSQSMHNIHNVPVAGPTPLSPTTAFLTAGAHSPTPSFRLNDITTHPTDDAYPPSPRIPSVSLGHWVYQHSLSPTTPSDSASITSAQTTAQHISFPVIYEPDPSTPVPSPPIPELVLTPSDDDAGTSDNVLSSPSMIPIASLLPSPPPLTSDMPPTYPLSSPTPSSSQYNKLPPDKEPPSRSSTTSTPILIRQSSLEFDPGPSIALSEMTDDAPDIPMVQMTDDQLP